ncbi:sialic acid-binding Ig-like lectin 5 isoform X1 [Phyllostomus hastatus]|uniref:sialic acid-binding Ig-like lectin 5 isoform X1 n=1 Tax=Phyllostomus hastatus TaxID=9423 RepID=UPI001E67E421|nr:sialic acid-binding Ig-like lectin 5 isoform X1 [Phyllostomus hastatus]
MVPLLLLLPLLWEGSLQEKEGYELQVQELVRVHEGLWVYVPCSFSYPRSSSFDVLYTYWYRSGDNVGYPHPVATNSRKQVKKETQGRFFLMDPETDDCSLIIRDARKSDTGIYVFRLEKGKNVRYTYQDKKLTLQVTDQPDILTVEPLQSGRSTQLTCSLPGFCQGGSPLAFSWMGAAVDSLNHQNLHSSVLTFTPRPQDHGTNLTCEVKCQRSRVTMERTIRLNVFFPPQLLGPSCSWEDGSLHCSCSSQAKPTPSVHWWLREGLLEGNHSNFSYTVTYSSSGPWANSSLSLPMGLAELGLSCEAENVHGAQRSSVLLLPGKLVSVWRVVPAALGGAGVTALLFLCLCLILFCVVKNHRRQAAGRRKVTNDEDPVLSTATWGSQQNPRTHGPSDQESPTGDTSAEGEEQDTQYANLRFHGRKKREPQDREATSTCLYSEIKKRSQ